MDGLRDVFLGACLHHVASASLSNTGGYGQLMVNYYITSPHHFPQLFFLFKVFRYYIITLWSWLLLNVLNGFPLPFFVCWLPLPGEGVLVQAGICRVFRAGSTNVKLLNRCCLVQIVHRPEESGKEQKHELIAFAACSKGKSVPCVLICVYKRYGSVKRSAQWTGLFTPASPLPPSVLQSEVLRLVPPLEGSPVHVSHFLYWWIEK